MLTLKYRDEDGIQEAKFKTQSELDEFVSFNEEKSETSIDEKFEVISITGSEESEVTLSTVDTNTNSSICIKMDISVLLDYSASLIKPQVQIIHLLTEVELPFTSDFETMLKIAQDEINNLPEGKKIVGSPKVYLVGWSQVKEYRV